MNINSTSRAHVGVRLNIGFLIAFLFFSTSNLFSQALQNITGTILDGRNNTPMPDVSVVVKGTGNGAKTGSNGEYVIKAKRGDVLVFTFSGYTTHEVNVQSQTKIDVTLKESTSKLDEVIVVGYGKQRKATLTGSVASVSSKELAAVPATNISQSISGTMPGVIALNRGGEPGRDNAEILIRGRNTIGTNSPLIVIDGVANRGGWENINPNDIESISILKDASAAIYGAQAANGVVLITTKRGKIGKPTINYTFNQGITKPTRLPQMANSATYADFANQLLVEAGQQPRYTAADIQKFADGSDPINYPNTNWLRETFRSHSSQSQHNLALRGGSSNVKYSISGSFTEQGKQFKRDNTKFNTYSILSNLDAQVSKNIKVALDLRGQNNVGEYPFFSTAAAFQFARINFPMQPVFWQNGLPSAGLERGMNPIVVASDASGYSRNNTRIIQTKASFDVIIPFVKGLGVDGFFAYDLNFFVGKNLAKPWTVYDYNKNTNVYTPVTGGNLVRPELRELESDATIKTTNIRIKYDGAFEDHKISTFIAAEQSESYSHNFNAFRRNYLSTVVDQLFAGDAANQEATGTAFESARQNVFGRINYGFNEKYLFDFNFRYDGSTNFPKGKRFGFFPGVSVAWRIAQEKFLDRLPAITDLKLRGSWGKMGNDQIAAFQYISAYQYAAGYNFGQTPTLTQGLAPGVTPNPNITWEVAQTSNIGLDGELWRGLLGFTVDVFKTKRSNILTARNASVPAYTGLVLPNENLGIVENKGIELELSHRNTIGKVNYRIGGNIGYNKSKIIFLDEPTNIPVWQKQEGHIVGAANYYHAIGIFRTADQLTKNPVVLGTKVGDLMYEDVNADGVINALDQKRMDKTNTPQIVFGINMSASYKNFSFTSLWQGQTKAYQYFFLGAGLNGNSLQELLENRWRPGSMNSKYPRLPSLATEVSGLNSDFWLRDATYIRLKSLEVSYAVPQKLLSKVGIQGLRVYVNGFNLLTFDKLKIFDPEGSSTSGDFYPQNKIFNFGFNLNF